MELTNEDRTTYETLAEGYNRIRHSKGWPVVSVLDLIEWEKYKKEVISRIQNNVAKSK